MASGSRKDPYLGFRFLVELNQIIVGGFSDVSGLQSEVKYEEYREGGVNGFVRKLPKYVDHSNIILKRGITDSDELWKWYQDVIYGDFKRKLGSIILIDRNGNECKRWNFFRAYPIRWIGPELKADSNSVAIESVELVHEGIEQINGGK